MDSSKKIILGAGLGSALMLGGIVHYAPVFSKAWRAMGSHLIIKASYPANQIDSALKQMCVHDYHMSVEARHQGNNLQAFFWRVGLLKTNQLEMRNEAAEALERVLLCATRVALSTDAPLQFVEIKMADVLTGATVTLWRYVPDIRDSMLTRMSEDEYINRLVVEMNTEAQRNIQGRNPPWDTPITMPEFLAKQVVLRAKRLSTVGLQAHEDLSQPATLVVVIDNWPAIEKQGVQQQTKVTDLLERSSKDVLHGYGFEGFRGVILEDSRGSAVGSWKL
jgi:hypothetical protein